MIKKTIALIYGNNKASRMPKSLHSFNSKLSKMKELKKNKWIILIVMVVLFLDFFFGMWSQDHRFLKRNYDTDVFPTSTEYYNWLERNNKGLKELILYQKDLIDASDFIINDSHCYNKYLPNDSVWVNYQKAELKLDSIMSNS